MRLLMIFQGNPRKASSRVRGWQMAGPLQKLGAQVETLCADECPPGSGGSLLRRMRRRRYMSRLHKALKRADVVFAQRLVKGDTPLEAVLQSPRPLVYDFDDALFSHPTDDKGASLLKNPNAQGRNADWQKRQAFFRRFVDKAALCSVTPGLRAWVEQTVPGKSVVSYLPPVDTTHFVPSPGRREHCIGWVGSPFTAPYLRILEPGLHKVLDAHPDWKLLVLGAEEKHIGWTRPPRAEYVAWDMDEEPAQIQRMAFGINPLPDDEWSRGKGAYKVLQYMATGIPAVAGAVGVNVDLLGDGRAGRLVAPDGDWEPPLLELIGDPALCAKLGEAARRRVQAECSLEVCAEKLWRALQNVAKA